MNIISTELFLSWYEAADPNPEATTLNARIDAIKKLLKEKKSDFWIDMIRVYLGISAKDSNSLVKLTEKFVAADSNFPTENNENLVRCLASTLLCYKLNEPNSKLTNFICLGILNSRFLNQFKIYDKVPVIEFAKSFYITHSVSSRELNIDQYEERLDNLAKTLKAGAGTESEESTVNETMLSVIEELKKLSQANKALSEECNVLWWLFGEHTMTSAVKFKELDHSSLLLISAKELSDLTTFNNGFLSAEPVLNKVISDFEKGDRLSLVEFVKTLSEQLKKDTVTIVNQNLSEMTPCMLAIKESMQSTVSDDWSKAYKTSSHFGNSNLSFTALEISMQLYREFLYLKFF